MRKAAVAVIGSLLLLFAAGAVPAGGDNAPPPQWEFRDGKDALKRLKTDVGGALKLERSAEKLANADEADEARDELKNSLVLLNNGNSAADWMDDPFRDSKDPWSHFNSSYFDVKEADEDAIHATDKHLGGAIETAVDKKQAIYDLVSHELSSRTCSVLTNNLGPIKVNNVPVTQDQVTVEVACSVKINDIKIELPSTFITQPQPDSGSNQLEQNGKVLEEKPPAGAKDDGETFTTTDPVTGERIELVVIHGDSVDYYDEVM